MDRIQKGIASTITVTLYRDGTATDPTPDSATVTITRSDGTELVPETTAIDDGTGVFAYTLSPTDTALLDTLTAAWTVTFDSVSQTVQTTVEVVGGFVFTLADVRAATWGSGTNNDDTYRISTAQILEARTEVERALEHELGFALVPRYTSETVDGDGGTTFMLAQPYPRAFRSASITGTALTDAQLATLAVSPTGRLYYPSSWLSGYQNVVIGYEHGLSVPPPGAKSVALALAKRLLTGAPADDRATTMTTDEQTTTFYVPGADEPFDVPAANRFVRAHSLRTGIA